MPTSEQVRKVVGDYLASFPVRDRDAFLACFAEDATQVDPVPSPPNVGKEAIGAFWDNIVQMAEKLDPELHHLHVCGDEAALVFTMKARTGDGGTAIDIVDILKVDDDGKIASLRAYWDPAAMKPIS